MRRALGLVSLTTIVVTAALRLGDEGVFDRDEPLAGVPGETCLGFGLDGRGLGVACGSTITAAVRRAEDRFGLPAGCLEADLPGEVRHGDRLVFTGERDGCACVRRGRLPGPLRLLVGAGLDVNRDTAADLTALPGIGEAKARRIVESRARDGPFRDVDDLTRVHGIGPRTVERLAPFLEWEEGDVKSGRRP